MASGGYVLQLGEVPYLDAWELQRSLAGAVSQGAIPDTIVLLEHPPVVTLGRRTDETAVLHVPEGAGGPGGRADRGGKSTFHGPGQLVCYPILDLKRHGRDVKQYVRESRGGAIGTLTPLGVEATRIDGLTGVLLERPPRKIASIGVHVSRWVTTHGYALNVDLDPAPFTDWITACGLEDAMFTTIARELGRPATVDEVRLHAVAALEDVFGLELQELPAEDGAGCGRSRSTSSSRRRPSDSLRAGRRARRRGNAAIDPARRGHADRTSSCTSAGFTSRRTAPARWARATSLLPSSSSSAAPGFSPQWTTHLCRPGVVIPSSAARRAKSKNASPGSSEASASSAIADNWAT